MTLTDIADFALADVQDELPDEVELLNVLKEDGDKTELAEQFADKVGKKDNEKKDIVVALAEDAIDAIRAGDDEQEVISNLLTNIDFDELEEKQEEQ